ncbi:glycine--tRNA ligase subunit beta [Moraxella bovis]|uniref:Glycine--tRNA ligase beta subunit n=1 Tax=Moraxella bovis TaxID=476 RepID=A0AAQ2Q4V4_MORBO|nr:glycine--tRNA ligase subunit beta [Moraxella bovis]UYZ74787.1 glycine--tRNA ligase subunit beta [Moraxella bovis]UYZ79286.1 glycine--tRNA ligase subunit beta [Moraxella bovis]UYZ87766.1 glycine--tRNA ligase subunit beta [Moraxella bovis]UYZ90481.1 glycine--tRNA ligase subunit beta [Moraxella bovis]UYZ93171.1 glycine--tRNA ligase subunit beta [Moraxella bovis]
MSIILFELGCEELPPKSLKTLETALKTSLEKSLVDGQIAFDGIKSYAAPRRLAVQIFNVASVTPDKVETKKGPAVKSAFDETGELTRAGQGFLQGLNATGLNLTKADLITLSDKKGEYIGYELTVKGESVDELLPRLIQKALDELPIAKKMRSGADKHEFVRPVKWVVLMRDDAVISATIQGHQAGSQTCGHRFHAPDFVAISNANDYESVLENAYVIADFAKRQANIVAQVQKLSDEIGATAIVPDELLDEVTALVDYPVALRASFEERFLAVPQEALISTMQADQKYFCLTDDNGKLKPNFIFISNIDSKDKSAVILGNEKVVRPRLADAEFFFLQDQKRPLADFAETLKTRVFQDKLGTIWEKGERIAKLSAFISENLRPHGWDVPTDDVVRAGILAKADLATTLVGEFPELQGIAGTYYAHKSGEKADVANAIAEQYLPKFSGDELPKTDIGVCLALADRLDTIVGIFGINEAPTGSKDPFSLRRASIGVLRILIDKKLPLNLVALVEQALKGYGNRLANLAKTFTDVMEFINARYRAMYTEQGVNVDTIQAVQAINPHMPLDFDERIRAVQAFRALPQAQVLAENNKRVANILAKADNVDENVDESLLTETAEKALYQAILSAKETVKPLQDKADYQGVLTALTALASPLTDFFDNVMVNSDDENLKNNRLALLGQVRTLFLSVADIGVLQG